MVYIMCIVFGIMYTDVEKYIKGRKEGNFALWYILCILKWNLVLSVEIYTLFILDKELINERYLPSS